MKLPRWWTVLFQTADGSGGSVGEGDGGNAGGSEAEGAEEESGGKKGGEQGQKGKERPKYFDQLSPDIANSEDAKLLYDFPHMNDLSKAAINMKRKLARAVIVPDLEKPDPEELKTFREAMGLPENSEGYAIKTDAFKDVEGLDQFVTVVKKQAFGMSLTKIQAQKLFDFVMKLGKAGNEKISEERKQAADTFDARLLEAVGKDETKKTATLNLFKRFLIKRIANASIIKRLSDAGLIHDPDFVVPIAEKVEQYLGEEPFVEGGRRGEQKAKGKGTMGKYSKEFEEEYGS